MYSIFLKDETGDMIEDATSDNYLDALKVVAAWVEKVKPGFQVVIKDLTGLS